MPELGLSLLAWEIHHPEPTRIQALLPDLKLQTPVTVHATLPGTTHLRACLQTPRGVSVLG